ncbi:orotidine-5'-phosphate decarboxylase [Geodermatophilus sp. TF02-6]|uniref:orotidine-5'-phosphate decarboxylase n=1 Tax=Geodermatophilus sp. TF02-6 TaxID=2250575 RepID=UPI000DE835D9|nr:orotidine-5'-phosphate decarboxylase [Geodermatophilus sp. TF02-6]RBY76755.1 orotidine-5'-phosphate decarboxylase [Geodermatophilus sp. TF02-6]
MREPFGRRLADAVAVRGPLCVGIDPHAPLLERWDLPDSPAGLARFTDVVVDALAGSVAVLKPQLAFYERHGSRGLAVLEDAVARARDAGALVLLDAKRGDIGSTMDAYADCLRPGHPLHADAMTVSPYLGPGALQPAVDTARQSGGGLFVLARTSNPDAGTLQSARVGERTVAQVVVDTVRCWNTPDWVVGDPLPDVAAVRDTASRWGPATGSFGVVVGATLRALDVDLTGLGGPVLAPGLGAQGGSVADLRRLFGDGLVAGAAVVPTVSRDVLAAGPDRAGLRAAAERWAAELAG